VTRLRAALACAVALVLAGAATAAADSPALQITKVDTSGFPTVRVTVKTPTPVPPDAVSVSENGGPAATVATRPAAGGSSIALAIDTSLSMKGKPLADAIAAATRFVFSQSAGTQMAVFGFGDKEYAASQFSEDRTNASNALGQLGVGNTQGTAIYSAVVLASRTLAQQPAGPRTLVLLTDGASYGEKTTLDDAIAAARAAHVTVYAVSTSPQAPNSPLDQLTAATRGRTFAVADSSALQAAYSKVASSVGSVSTFRYQSLAPSGKAFSLTVSAPGLRAATTSATAPAAAITTSKPDSGPLNLPSTPLGRALVAGIAALFVLLAALIVLGSRPPVVVGKRIGHYTEQRKQAPMAPGTEVPKISMLHQLYVATEKVAGSLNYWQRMSYRLEQANLPMRTAEVVYMQLAFGVLLALIARVTFGLHGFLGLIPLLIGAALPVLYVKFKAARRMAAFEAQLPEMLITLAASLKAGHSFNSALNSVARDGMEPTTGELTRVHSEIQLGMPSEQALDAMAKRMNSTNFGFVVMAVNIQRTVGGSLADILDMVADTVRARQQFTQKVKALTAQGRMSAYVLLAMPFLMGLAIYALNPSYIAVLFSTTAGNVMLVGALVSMGIGAVIIRKIVSFKG
jgi:tight adherence protein B